MKERNTSFKVHSKLFNILPICPNSVVPKRHSQPFEKSTAFLGLADNFTKSDILCDIVMNISIVLFLLVSSVKKTFRVLKVSFKIRSYLWRPILRIHAKIKCRCGRREAVDGTRWKIINLKVVISFTWHTRVSLTIIKQSHYRPGVTQRVPGI
jgi:hypothetical protein